MVQPRHGLRLAGEALADLLAAVEVRVQHLDGHHALELRVEAAPDDRHASLADLLVEAVTAELQFAPSPLWR